MKKIISIIAITITIFNLLHAQTATAPSTGNGSSGDPYQIASLENLYWIAENSSRWNSYYVQTADIDASPTSNWFDNGSGGYYGWSPIGNSTTNFTGRYVGDHYTIRGLYINRPTTDNIGLFGYVRNPDATDGREMISKLGLLDVNITGYNNTGALIGYIRGWYSGSVDYPTLYRCWIWRCYSTGSVTGQDYTGGLIGLAERTYIQYSYSTCDVFGHWRVGGLSGALINYTVVEWCYSIGSVNGTQDVGGFAGFTSNYASLTACYSSGYVANGTYIGGFIGTGTGGSQTQCYWDTETSGRNSSYLGTGKTTAQMKTESTFTNWDFTNTWEMIGQNQEHYPKLQVFNIVELDNVGSSNFAVSGSKGIGFIAESGTIAVTFEYVNSAHVNIPPGGKSIGVYWEISNVSGNTRIRLYYTDTQKAEFTGTPKIYHYTGGQWVELPTAAEVNVDGTNFYVETTNYHSSFSPVTVGDDASPLPVELISFEGMATEDGVLLNWETATETNNYGFEVERENWGTGEWEKIGFVQGHGTTNSPKQYSFIDDLTLNLTHNPNLTRLDYRLKQIDNNGTFAYSKVVTVDLTNITSVDEEIVYKFALEQNYPNPFNPSTTIAFTVPSDVKHQTSDVKLIVYDILGREIATLVNQKFQPGNHEVQFDGSNLSSGMYFYRINVGSEYQLVKKMMLVK